MTTTTPKPGETTRMPAGKAIITRVESEGDGRRIYFRYLRNGRQSQTERNVWEAGR